VFRPDAASVHTRLDVTTIGLGRRHRGARDLSETGALRLSFLGLPDGKASKLAHVIAIVYVVVWFLAGASALVVGHLIIDDDVAARFQTLVDLGAAWFGLAIAAAYAFPGIKP
jgi:hypothetical protein